MANPERWKEIHDFSFGDISDAKPVDSARGKRWFSKQPETDRKIRTMRAAGRQSPQNEDLYFSPLDYALRHHAIIERFGRFPHRNAEVGRASKPEEEAFLKTPGSSF